MPAAPRRAAICTLLSIGLAAASAPPPRATPTLETDPRADVADAAVAPAVWTNSRDPAASLILGTHARTGVVAFDLGGRATQILDLPGADQIALCSLPGGTGIAAVSLRGQPALAFVEISAAGKLSLAPGLSIALPAPTPTAVALAPGVDASALDCVVALPGGAIEHHRLTPAPDGSRSAARATTFKHPAEVGAVAVHAGNVLVGDATGAIWRYPVQGGQPGAAVVPPTPKALIKPVIGLATFVHADGSGYLLATFDRSTQVVLYDLRTFERLRVFGIERTASVDEVQYPGEIAASAAALGATMPFGCVVVQDADNEGQGPNFKVLAWEAVARSVRPPLPLRPAGAK
ncbi:MAG: phytase [Planctomycetota bacterium]|nr:phytase [Planctomycetota bacterium]